MLSARDDALAVVDGWPINLDTQDRAVDAIVSAAAADCSFSAFTLNLDHIVKLRRDAKFRMAYAAARFVTADGQPVAKLAARQCGTIRRTTGADLVEPLMQACATEDLPVYLYGTSPEVLQIVVRELNALTNGTIKICGAEAPPYGFDPESKVADAALDRIKSSGAKVCLVALGAPKQELFAARGVAHGVPCGFVCIGAALDFIANAQVRAPQMVQKHGLEWAWRLLQNPRGLGARYARCAALRLELATRDFARGLVTAGRRTAS